MKVDKKILAISTLILLGIFAFFGWKYYTLLQDSKEAAKRYESIIDSSAFKFKNEITKAGNKIAKQEQLILTKEQALGTVIKESELKDLRIKKLQAQIKVKTETTVTDISAKFDSSQTVVITKPDEVVSGVKYLKVPTPFKRKNYWVSISGVVEESGVKFDTISFVNKPSITIGTVREKGFKGFFKRPKKSVIFKDENPYTMVTGMQNVIIEEKPKWYQTKLFWFGAGCVTTGLAYYGIKQAVK